LHFEVVQVAVARGPVVGIRDDEVSLAPLPVADTTPSASSKMTGTAALSASAEVGVIDGAARVSRPVVMAMCLRSTLDLPGSAAPTTSWLRRLSHIRRLVLPFLTGERSTEWVSDARAARSGVSVATSASSLNRDTMEGVAVSYARIAEQLTQVAATDTRVLASGRVAREVPGLLQLLADVLDIPVEAVLVKRSTLRGTAVLALQRLAPDVRREPPARAQTRRPRPLNGDYYAQLRNRFSSLYDSTVASPG
jgi:gluconokinase